VVEPFSNPVAPRVAPVCRLDRPCPRPSDLCSSETSWRQGSDRSVVVLVRRRSDGDAAQGGVRGRTRPGECCDAQSAPAEVAGDPARYRRATGHSPDRSDPRRVRTDVRRAHEDDDCVDGQGAPACGPHGDMMRSTSRLVVYGPPIARSWMQRQLLSAIDFYQRAREGRPSPCRFTPSCSSYAHESLNRHGVGRGTWLTVRRLVRCRPFGPSGYDPVPPVHDERSRSGRRLAVQKG
jgi:putative membrane protein insertion efficiency factor